MMKRPRLFSILALMKGVSIHSGPAGLHPIELQQAIGWCDLIPMAVQSRFDFLSPDIAALG